MVKVELVIKIIEGTLADQRFHHASQYEGWAYGLAHAKVGLRKIPGIHDGAQINKILYNRYDEVLDALYAYNSTTDYRLGFRAAYRAIMKMIEQLELEGYNG